MDEHAAAATVTTGRADVHQQPVMALPNNHFSDRNSSGEAEEKERDTEILSGANSVPLISSTPPKSAPNLQALQQQSETPKLFRKMSRRISIHQTAPSSAEKARNSAAHVLLDWLQGSFDNHRQLMSESDSGLLLDNCHPWVHINIKPIVIAQQQKPQSNTMPPMSYIEYADNNPLHATRTQLLIFSPLPNDVKSHCHSESKQPICMQMFDVETSELEQLTEKLQQQQHQHTRAKKSALRYRAASLDFECGTGKNATADVNAEQNPEISELMANAKQITTIIWHVHEKQDKFLGFIQPDAATSCIRIPSFVNPGIRSKSANENRATHAIVNGEADNETDDGFSDGSSDLKGKKSSWMSSSLRFLPVQNKQQYGSIKEAVDGEVASAVADSVVLNDIIADKEDGQRPDLILSLNELFIANSHIISRFQPPATTSIDSNFLTPDAVHLQQLQLSDSLIPFFHFRRCSLYTGSIEMSEDKTALDSLTDAERLSLKQIILHDQGDRATLIGAKTGVKYQVELAVVPWLDRDGLRIAVYEADNDMPCAMTVTAESQYIQLSLSWLNIRFTYCDDYIEMFNNNSTSTTIHDKGEEEEEVQHDDNVSLNTRIYPETPVAPTVAFV